MITTYLNMLTQDNYNVHHRLKYHLDHLLGCSYFVPYFTWLLNIDVYLRAAT